ncbi:hypothetical protein VTO42DRAFT_7894 [Malbranchea cinnamomea]
MDSPSYPSLTRSTHRRYSVSELSQPAELQQMASGGPGAAPAMSEGSQIASGSRVSSASGRSSRTTQPDKQLSQIEKSVTHLLIATKQLLETLTQWSRKQASETQVSDVYVRLGYEFNLACRAFGAIGVETTDLGPVPDLLRTILEDTLSQEASPESLERYLPRIRDIIINLLHGLKRKQARLRSRHAREGRAGPRQGSAGSAGSGEQPDDAAAFPQSPSRRLPEARQGVTYGDEQQPYRSTSSSWSSERRGGSFSEREAGRREAQRSIAASTSSSSMSSSAMQNLPVVAPHSENFPPPAKSDSPSTYPNGFHHPPPPPPPPKQNDAIGMLQRSGELERRASRRFSAYQIQKHLGASSNGVSVLPSSQLSRMPDRGRDVRESLNAVRLRGAHLPKRSSRALTDAASVKSTQTGGDAAATPPRVQHPSETSGGSESPTKTAMDKVRSPRDFQSRDVPVVGGRLPGLPEAAESDSLQEDEENRPEDSDAKDAKTTSDSRESTPPPGKELTLFLQYKSKIKKYVLPEGASELTIGRLQLAFIEKFAWNTHNNGADLPEIYIQDPISGVRHELEDLSDVKDRSVLVLNVEALDEVKKHFDDNLGGLRRLIEGVRDVVESQGAAIQRLTDRQMEAAKDIARLAAAPPTPPPSEIAGRASSQSFSGKVDQHAEIQSLRRDLALLRQTYSSFASDITASMNNIRAKAGQVKSAAVEMTVPNYEGDAGRAHINAGKKQLAEESEKLVARVDDLQDLVEDLRKDVVTRGVRPLPRQLEAVGRDIAAVTKELKKMQEFLRREKPIWTKIWEKELQLVCEERDQLTMQEDLAVDLEDDLEKATQTFALVEQATKQQALSAANGGTGSIRSTSRSFPVDPTLDPQKAKDNVLGEVRALRINHENRVEAIERAEKARQKELENRRDGQFQKELRNFVQEGKLRKTGGIEEMERLRQEKEERIRKEVWERQMGLVPLEPETTGDNVDASAEESGEIQAASPDEASQDSNDDGPQTPNSRDSDSASPPQASKAEDQTARETFGM